MSLRVSFELDDNDLQHFRLIMREARKLLSRKSPEDIIAEAKRILQDFVAEQAPGFVVDRLRSLRQLMQMISDLDWRLPHDEAKRVLNALAYFAEPDDLIPDQIPGLGFLDDAIMVELVVRELRHELEAYHDFCEYRERSTGRRSDLDARRDELQARMRRRRLRSEKRSGKSGLRLFD